LTTEKTYQPTTVRQEATGGAFFRKAEEPGFLSRQEAAPYFNTGHIQPKLSVSQPDDPQEKEADAMADRVMRLEADDKVMLS